MSPRAAQTIRPGNAARRPRLALRVGVTGARDLPSERLGGVRSQLFRVLALVRQEMADLAESADARRAYQPAAPELRLLSPLAEGADRLAAEAALELGYRLYVPMPFRRAEYVRDFLHKRADRGGAEEFERLLKRADAALELDGARDDPGRYRHDEARSYEAVGRLVVRNCDLLIAVWDGASGKGRGGTADMVQYSAKFGPPVWWVHAKQDQPPIWVDDGVALDIPPGDGAAEQALRCHLANLIVPPASQHEGSPAFCESVIKRPRPKPPADAVASHWYHHCRAADDRVAKCAMRYRLVQGLVFLLAALSVAAAAVSVAARHDALLTSIMTGLQLIALGVILGFVIARQHNGWHTRWMDCRLIAELCRQQQSLAPLGWSVPVRAAAAGPPAWAVWYFGALLRSAPLPEGVFDTERTRRTRAAALEVLAREQSRRKRQHPRAAKWFTDWAERLFVLALVLVIAKLLILAINGPTELDIVLGVPGIVLPALAAASVGAGAYSELQALAGQSPHVEQSMQTAEKNISALDVEGPLASQQLGALIYGVTTLMLEDVPGWARLFRANNIATAPDARP